MHLGRRCLEALARSCTPRPRRRSRPAGRSSRPGWSWWRSPTWSRPG